jgi:hypothetical protein
MTSPTPRFERPRQRAGRPADYDDPAWIAKTEADLEKELQRQFKRDLKAIAFIGACIFSFWLVVWGTLP